MYEPRLTLTLSVLVMLASNSPAWSNDWTCRHGKLVRQVTIFYPQAPATLPCRVYYSKPTEGAMPRVLWNATNLENYCERKAEVFVAKLRSFGWQCTRDPASDR